MRARISLLVLVTACSGEEPPRAPPQPRQEAGPTAPDAPPTTPELPTLAAPAGERWHMVVVGGVRLRESASPSGQEGARVVLGTPVLELERNAGAGGPWVKVRAGEGKKIDEGWITAEALRELERDRLVEAQLALWEERGAKPDLPFVERADLLAMLRGVKVDPKDREAQARMTLLRLRALKRALEAVPMEEMDRPPYKGFIQRNQAQIVYSEPAGAWMVNTAKVWEQVKKLRDADAADDLAWEAASSPVPGECEGYIPCYIAVARMQEGEYLLRYPAGRHVSEALTKITEVLPSTNADLYADLDAAGLDDGRKQIAQLLRALRKVKSDEKRPAVEALKQIDARLAETTPSTLTEY